jgi:hypothetical protein
MKFRVFWDVAPCSHVEVGRRFGGAYCLHHQGDEFLNFTVSETECSYHYVTLGEVSTPSDPLDPSDNRRNNGRYLRSY